MSPNFGTGQSPFSLEAALSQRITVPHAIAWKGGTRQEKGGALCAALFVIKAMALLGHYTQGRA